MLTNYQHDSEVRRAAQQHTIRSAERQQAGARARVVTLHSGRRAAQHAQRARPPRQRARGRALLALDRVCRVSAPGCARCLLARGVQQRVSPVLCSGCKGPVRAAALAAGLWWESGLPQNIFTVGTLCDTS